MEFLKQKLVINKVELLGNTTIFEEGIALLIQKLPEYKQKLEAALVLLMNLPKEVLGYKYYSTNIHHHGKVGDSVILAIEAILKNADYDVTESIGSLHSQIRSHNLLPIEIQEKTCNNIESIYYSLGAKQIDRSHRDYIPTNITIQGLINDPDDSNIVDPGRYGR